MTARASSSAGGKMWIQKLPAGVRALTFSADGRALYVLDARGVISAWDTAARTGQPVHRVASGPRRHEVELGTACGDRFLVLQFPAFAHIWDLAAGAEHARLPVEPNGFRPQLDPTRRLLVAPDSQRERLATWDVAERKPGPPLLRADPTTDRFGEFAATADGNTIAVRTAQRQVALYDRPANRAFARFDSAPAIGPIEQLAFSPDGKTLALFGVDRIALWDVASRTVRAGRVFCCLPAHVSAVHPTLPVIAARNSNLHLTLFSLDTGEPLRALDLAVGSSTVSCTAFAPDGLTCAVGGTNKQFAVFDVDL